MVDTAQNLTGAQLDSAVKSILDANNIHIGNRLPLFKTVYKYAEIGDHGFSFAELLNSQK